MPGIVDTLNIYQRLKSANLNDEAAKEIAEVIKDVTESGLVTTIHFDKTIEITKLEFQKEIETTKAELQKEIETAKAELQKEIEITRAEIYKSKADILKWVAGMLVAQTGIIAALVKLL